MYDNENGLPDFGSLGGDPTLPVTENSTNHLATVHCPKLLKRTPSPLLESNFDVEFAESS